MICPGHWEEEKWYYLGHENAGRFMRALGWVQFLADCASVVALFLLLGDQDPTQYRKIRQAPPLSPVNSSYQNDMSLWHLSGALAVGYVLTTNAQLVAAATLAYNYCTQVSAHRAGRVFWRWAGATNWPALSWLHKVCGTGMLVDKVVAAAQCAVCATLTLVATVLLFVMTPLNLFFDFHL